jgi:glycosyltransferase involved in cell wall biosynthesis
MEGMLACGARSPCVVFTMYSPHESVTTSSSLETSAASKVLLVHNSYRQPGGEDQVVNAEANLLRSYGHEVLLYEATNADIHNPLAVLGQMVWNQTSFRDLRALVQQTRPDVVHVHNTFPVISPAVLYAAAEERVPVVHTLHNYRLLCPAAIFYRDGQVCEECVHSRSFLPAVFHACYRHSHLTTAAAAVTLRAHRLARSWQRHVAAYIALTEFARQKFVENGFDPCKMHVKPNFIRLDPGMGSGNGGYALFVGRLTEEKGIVTLLRAWRQLGDRFQLEIIGEGPLSSEVKAAQLTMSNLCWHGWLSKDQVLARMQRADMLIIPSEWYEGFPVTLLEAFATGLPALVSRIGSLAGLVEEKKTGVQFEAGNAAELADKVRFLFTNPDLLWQMRRACREEYEKKYTAEANYAILTGIYGAVLNSHCESSGPFSRNYVSSIKSERTDKPKVVMSAL